MAYDRTKWQDHVVERPRTYNETINSDGSTTFTPAPGETLQQGTPQSATNFNNVEDALQNLNVAYDMLYTIMYATIRAQAKQLETLESELNALQE